MPLESPNAARRPAAGSESGGGERGDDPRRKIPHNIPRAFPAYNSTILWNSEFKDPRDIHEHAIGVCTPLNGKSPAFAGLAQRTD